MLSLCIHTAFSQIASLTLGPSDCAEEMSAQRKMKVVDPGNSVIALAIQSLQHDTGPSAPEGRLAAFEARRLTTVQQLADEISNNPTSALCAAHAIVELAIEHIQAASFASQVPDSGPESNRM